MYFSSEDVTIVLNGHEVEGLSDDGLSMPDAVDATTVRMGSRPGDKAFFRTAERGGEVTVPLLPTSLSLPFFMQQAMVHHDGGTVVWDGTVIERRRNITHTLSRGMLTQYPVGLSAGAEAANRDFVFNFTEIVSDYSSASVFEPTGSESGDA